MGAVFEELIRKFAELSDETEAQGFARRGLPTAFPLIVPFVPARLNQMIFFTS